MPAEKLKSDRLGCERLAGLRAGLVLGVLSGWLAGCRLGFGRSESDRKFENCRLKNWESVFPPLDPVLFW